MCYESFSKKIIKDQRGERRLYWSYPLSYILRSLVYIFPYWHRRTESVRDSIRKDPTYWWPQLRSSVAGAEGRDGVVNETEDGNKLGLFWRTVNLVLKCSKMSINNGKLWDDFKERMRWLSFPFFFLKITLIYEK